MRLGIQVNAFTWPGAPQDTGKTFRRIAVDAERSGLASLWVMDHFFQISVNGPPEQDMLEGWSALAFAAGATERIKLGTMVTGVTYRYPGMLHQDGHDARRAFRRPGLPGHRGGVERGGAPGPRGSVPAIKERFERLEETLQLAHQMCNDDESPFVGAHYSLERPLNSPAIGQPAASADPDRRQPAKEDAADGGAVRRRLQHLRDADPGHPGANSTCCKSTAPVLVATTPRSRRPRSAAGAITRDGADGTQSVEQAIDRFGKLAEIGIDQALFGLPHRTSRHLSS